MKKLFSFKAMFFVSTIIILLVFVVFSFNIYQNVYNISSLAETIHNHPLVVSNNASQVNTNILKMHRSMKDAVLSTSEMELIEAVHAVQEVEEDTLAKLDIIDSNILGDEGKVLAKSAREAFIGWRPIRNRVLALLENGNYETAADITKNEGARYVINLEGKVNELYNYAITKSNSFMSEINQSNKQALNTIFYGLILVLFATVAVHTFVARRVLNSVNHFNSNVTTIISTGNYQDIVPGNIFEIKPLESNFNKMTSIIRQQFWIKDGMNALQKQLVNKKSERVITSIGIRFISQYLGAVTGALFLLDANDIISKSASYAGKKDNKSYSIGEGIIGQVAKDKHPITLNNISNDVKIIETGTLVTTPVNVFVFPIIFADESCNGVIEIVTTYELADFQKQFLLESGRIMGSFIESINQLEKINSLLRDTQLANEQLQQQSLELEENARELENNQLELEENQRELEEINYELEKQQVETSQKNQELLLLRDHLMQKSQELSKSNSLKSEFLANMSHELRTPLNSIILLSKNLIDKGNLAAEQREKVQVINSASDELLVLINNILDISKVESGKMEVSVEEISTIELSTRLERLFNEVANNKGIKFILKDYLKTIFMSDKQKIVQILSNFLSNAFKFTKEGSVSLIFKKGNTAEYPILIEVEDTGIGISEDKQKIIFEEFVQGDGSITRQYGGTGLGLSITQKLSELIGGKVSLKSKEHIGSTFTLHLPAEMIVDDFNEIDDDVVTKTVVKANDFTKKDHLILLIDDDSSFITEVKQLVKMKGYSFVSAKSGYEGIRKAIELKPKGIILDLVLPDITGGRVLKELKLNPVTRGIPVHILSGKDCDHIVKLKQSGAIGYQQKSQLIDVDIDLIINRIEEVINKRPKSLLIAEDHHEEVESILEMIKDWNLNIKITDTVHDTIECLEKQDFDAAVVDLQLKDGPGFDICKYAKETKIDTPVIVYTAKDLTKKEYDRLRTYSDSIILKTATSKGNLLEEIAIFIHKIYDWDENLSRNEQFSQDVLKHKKVLLCDDDSRNVFTLTTILEDLGIEVHDAYSGNEAIEKLMVINDIDLVLMDIMMPEMDGYQTIKKIRQQSRFAQLPIIALTAKAMKGDREKCLQAGANDYMSKPIDFDLFLKLITMWMRD